MMAIRPFGRDGFSLLDDLVTMQSEFNRLFDTGTLSWGGRAYPPVNVWTSEDQVTVDVELPGVDPADVDVSVKGHELSIKGERKPGTDKDYARRECFAGRFERSIVLPYRVESGKVGASYRNGILSITLPRAESDKPRTVKIETA